MMRQHREEAGRWQRAQLRLAVVVMVVAGLAGALGSAAATQRPTCFGAAARDAVVPCKSPTRGLSVVPTPAAAQIMPNTPCTPIHTTITACTFGVPVAQQRGTVALVGDSHAWHWRGAIDVAAQGMGWQGISITRPSCPLTAGRTLLSEPLSRECTHWNHGVIKWFRQHPEISVLFTSEHPGSVLAGAGQSLLDAQVAGITAEWKAFPASVKHIIVIRDIPYAHEDTLPCIEQAISRHEDAGVTCALQRTDALRADPAAVAAQRLHSPRVQLIDLTRFFCDSRLCYPVVGGALVYRDYDHLTSTFAISVGPYLLHELGHMMASWG